MNANIKTIRVPSVVHPHGEPLMTLEDVLLRLGLSEEGLARRVERGEVNAYRIDGERRFELVPPSEREPLEPIPDQLQIRRDALKAALERFATENGRAFEEHWPLVYVIQAGEDGPLKIGVSGSIPALRRRLYHMQTGSPELLLVRRLLKGGRPLELRLHKQFRADGIRGEWFKPSPELLAFAGVVGQRERRKARRERA